MSPAPLPKTSTDSDSPRPQLISNPSMDQLQRLVPYEFALDDYADECENTKPVIFPSFYTHEGGYKMCVGVVPQGNVDGNLIHVSIVVYMNQGEHDDKLKWPFKGDITIQLHNQLGDWCHHEVIIRFTKKTPRVYSGR